MSTQLQVGIVGGWQPIRTAPKDEPVLLFGKMNPFDGLIINGQFVFSGYWDAIDSTWCMSGATWIGPFADPTHWMPLPEPPSEMTR